MIMPMNLGHRVSTMKLPQSKPLQPLFEAIVNSFQSLEELGDVDGKSIRIFAERDTVLDDDPLSVTNSPICGFVIEDNGVGFNEANIGSFLTSDSDYKARLGGKGVGRFMWLKAFSRAEIYSRFEDGGYWERSFTFSLSSDLSKPPASPTEKSVRLTRISLKDYQSPYKEEAPRSLDILAQRIVEHCLAFFLDAKCPTVILEGTGGEKFNLNEYFGEYIGDRASTHPIASASLAKTSTSVEFDFITQANVGTPLSMLQIGGRSKLISSASRWKLFHKG